MPRKQTGRTKTSRRKSSDFSIMGHRMPGIGFSRLWRHFFGHRPPWTVWLGIVSFALLYVFIFYYVFVGPFTFRWKALYGDIKYPQGYSIQGIDISHYQGTINWDKLRTATIDGNPVRFVFIKSTEGESMIDKNFNDNFYQAREHDLIRGAYHFFVPSVPYEKQARHFLRQVHLEDGDLPPVLDIEHTGKLTAAQIKKQAIGWLRIVEKHYGVKPIIYTNHNYKETYLSDSIFDTYPYWIAHYYVDELKYQGKWRFWQHTDRGTLPGIKGYVDFNIYNGSMYDLMKFTIGSKEAEE